MRSRDSISDTSLPRSIAILAAVVLVVVLVAAGAVAIQGHAARPDDPKSVPSPAVGPGSSSGGTANRSVVNEVHGVTAAAPSVIERAASTVQRVVARIARPQDGSETGDRTVPTVTAAGIWTLSNPTVIKPGIVEDAPQGSMILDRVVRADATSGVGERMIFTITFTQFEPSKSAPTGTTAGHSYLQGAWRLLPQGSSADARHPAGEIRGTLRAQSKEDILRSRGDFTAAVELLGPQAVGGRGSGGGEYRGSAEFDGRLTLPHVTPVTVSKE